MQKRNAYIVRPYICGTRSVVTHGNTTKKPTRTKHDRKHKPSSSPNHKRTTLFHSTQHPENAAHTWIWNNNRNPQKFRNILRTQQRLSPLKRSREPEIFGQHMGNTRFSPKKNLQNNFPRTEPVELPGAFVWTHADGNQNDRNYTANCKRIKITKK